MHAAPEVRAGHSGAIYPENLQKTIEQTEISRHITENIGDSQARWYAHRAAGAGRFPPEG